MFGPYFPMSVITTLTGLCCDDLRCTIYDLPSLYFSSKQKEGVNKGRYFATEEIVNRKSYIVNRYGRAKKNRSMSGFNFVFGS